MIKIESFAKQNKSNVSNNGGGFVKSTTIINNNTTTQVSGELDTHTFWGQPYNGTQDVSGDLNGVGDINASGDITTTGNINGNNLVGSNVNATNVNANNIDADSGTIDELSTLTLNSDNINNSGAISTDSISGNTGTFTTLVSTNGTITNLSVDNLTAKAAHFFELTIDEIKSVGGQIIVTPANATLDKVEKVGNTYKCYFKATDGEKKITNQFAVNDQVVCSSFNAAEGTTYDVSNKFYWAKITEVSNAPVTIDGEDYHYFIIDWNDKDSDSNGVPETGDKVAQLGNRTNAARQAAIIISAYQNQFLDNGVNAPSIVQYDGINDYSLSTHRYNVISKGLNQFKGSFTTSTGDDIVDLINDMGEGALTYVHTAYANSADGSTDFSKSYFNNALYVGLCSNHTESDAALKYTDYTWSRFKGADGDTPYIKNNYWWIGNTNTGVIAAGKDGYTPYIENNKWYINGVDSGIVAKGEDGNDGLTPFIYNGTWWIGTTDTGIKAKGEKGDTPYIKDGYWYIGEDSTNIKAEGETPYIKNGYWWIGDTNTNVKAEGVDGTTYYTWIRYADTISADGKSGTGISNTPTKTDGTFKEYIGFAYNKTTATESNTYADYKWTLFKGTDGTNGVDGVDGKDGKTYYTWIKYADKVPTKNSDIYDTPKSTTEYIGIATNQESQTESSDYTKYIWSKFKGEQGIAGTDGETPYIKNGNWWIGNTDTGIVAQGSNGITFYTWIKYANSISTDGKSGSGISNSPTNSDGTFKKYIGFAYNKTTSTESSNYSDYSWTLFKGTDGTNGINGQDGTTYYTWIKYSDVVPTKNSDIYDSPKTTTEYIGIAVNQTVQTESTDYTKYTWSKFKGDKGVDGTNGVTPHIENGYWYIGDVNTNVKAEGLDGETPRIVNGYWWVGDYNTGVKAEGTDGSTPYIQDGYWYVDGVSLDVKATGEDGTDAEFYRLVKNVEKAIVDKDGTLGIVLQYQIAHIKGNTLNYVTASTNGYWIRFRTDNNTSTYYNLSVSTTTPKYTKADFMTNYHKSTNRPLYLVVQLMFGTSTIKDTLVVPVIFDAAATLTITDEITATVQANKAEIDGELVTVKNDITTVSQKADGIETTVSNHTTQISALNNNVQSHTDSISALNQRADSISASVSTNADNITHNYNAIQDLTIDTEGIKTNVAKNTTDISNLYADPNLFGMGTYNGTTSANNKFFVKDGTAKTVCTYNDRYNTFVYNAYFDYLQYGNGNSGLYTPYLKGDDVYYTLAIDNINVENVSRVDIQIVTYSSEYDAKNDTNGSIGTIAWYDTTDDMYESNYLIRLWLKGWVRIKIKLTCTNVADDNEGNIYGQGIRLYKGEFTKWEDLPKTVSYIENISSTISQTATDITTTVNRNVIESMNLLEQTNFNGLSNMDKWFKYTNLSGVIETGFNGSNAYKVNITGGNQVFLSQIIYKTDLSIAKVMPHRKYTFSCYFKDLATGGTQPSEMNNVTFCICKSSDYATSSNNIYADEFIYTNTNQDWQYFTTTFEMPQMLTNTYYLVIRCANMQEAANFYICQPKLEIGNTATNYTQEVSDASSSMIQQTADKIRLQVQNCGIDITNSKISLNGNTEINGALTISDEDTGFVLQGEGGATQISPKSVGDYDNFINNSTTNISQLSNSSGVEQAVDESYNYFTFSFSNAFNLGKIANGKSITITPSTQTFFKDYGSGNKIDITNKVFNKSNKIRIYENWTLQRTITTYAEFSYVAQGTGVIAIYIDTECSIPKAELDRGTGRLSADVSNTTLLNWSVPNDAYTLLGYDGLGLNFGTSANAFINKDNAIFRYGSAGLRISVNGVTKWNGSEWVNILTPVVYRLTDTSFVWGNSEVDILVSASNNNVTCVLPSNPYLGRKVQIRKAGSGNITVSANKTMRSGYSGYVNSYQVNNAKLCTFLYDGTMWLINYEN